MIGGRAVALAPEATAIALPDGEHTYVLHAGGRWAVGALRLAAGHRVEIAFDPRSRLVGYVERASP